MRPITIVSCTRGAKEGSDLYGSLARLPQSLGEVRFFENNREGLAAQYNAALDALAGQDRIVILAHDDVAIDDPIVAEKLNVSVDAGFAVMGLAGTSTFTINSADAVTMWLQQPLGPQSGRVRHRLADGSIVESDYGPVPRRCVVMDGLFLAVHLPRLGETRFDEQFGFHFYDLDFCMSAVRNGLQVGTTNVDVIHRGGWNYDSGEFQQAQARFRRKWGEGQFAVRPAGPEGLGRNDPCYCGSGLRFKHCHGKAGAVPAAGG